MTPAEAFAGKDKIRKSLHDQVRRMLGLEGKDTLTPEEKAAIAEIEREIAEQFPWAQDEAALNQVWQEHGKMSINPLLGLAGVSGAVDVGHLIGGNTLSAGG